MGSVLVILWYYGLFWAEKYNHFSSGVIQIQDLKKFKRCEYLCKMLGFNGGQLIFLFLLAHLSLY